MKIVCDSNVILSAIVFGGVPKDIMDLARSGTFDLYLSPAILVEVARILGEKFHWARSDVERIIRNLNASYTLIYPKQEVTVIKIDPSDNAILACALAAKANYIITGDKKHLLPKKKFRGIPILSPATFFREVIYKSA